MRIRTRFFGKCKKCGEKHWMLEFYKTTDSRGEEYWWPLEYHGCGEVYELPSIIMSHPEGTIPVVDEREYNESECRQVILSLVQEGDGFQGRQECC